MADSLLGKTVKDNLTGFTGVVIGHVDYLYGKGEAWIQPKCVDGDFKKAQWISVERLVVLEDKQ